MDYLKAAVYIIVGLAFLGLMPFVVMANIFFSIFADRGESKILEIFWNSYGKFKKWLYHL